MPCAPVYIGVYAVVSLFSPVLRSAVFCHFEIVFRHRSFFFAYSNSTMSARQDKMRRQCSLILNDDFIENVKFAQLIYEKPFLGLLVTRNDQVYAVGADSVDYFGLGPVSAIPQLTKIDVLCGQKMKIFAAGSDHILALSYGGVVYAWGCNSKGQLGDSTTDNSTAPIVVSGDLTDKMVLQVECGTEFSVALTDEGKVYTWGSNASGRTGLDTTAGVTTAPVEVGGLLADKVVISISCSVASVVCLTNRGQVITFGYSLNLGFGDNFDRVSPVQAKIADAYWIQDVRCGTNHTLAMTNNGILLTWGCNSSGELGLNSTTNYVTPTVVKVDESFNGKVLSITAEGETSFAETIYGNVYVWGLVNGEKVLRPMKCDVDFPKASMSLSSYASNIVVSDLAKSFEDKETCDFIFVVDQKEIPVHISVLRIRSPEFFRPMFSGHWKEEKVVKTQYSYEVYREFIRYHYRGKIGDLDPDDVLDLMDLAQMALDENLVQLCTERVKKDLKFENVLQIFCQAMSLDQDSLAEHCVRFAMRGLKYVIRSEAWDKIDAIRVREFITMCYSYGTFTFEA